MGLATAMMPTNAQRLTLIVVEASSHAAHLACLNLFPSAEFMQVCGRRRVSLEGIEPLRTELTVDADLRENNCRSLVGSTW
jgi:hypothetical protein